jgi:hypothetical protein
MQTIEPGNKMTREIDIRGELRTLRKKANRVQESRKLIKAKSREKGKIIKAQQDRQVELEKNRDDWKARCKEQEKARKEADDKYRQVADLLNMKEEQLKDVLKEFEEFKKKHPLKKK